MPNALTTEVGFKVGPVLLEVLAKHYLGGSKERNQDSAKLRKDDILYDEGFTIVKAFMNAASWHTVEDLQSFSNTRTPSPPWIHVVRTIVPMSSCDQAATYLIKALGGEDHCRKVIGGVKWWQVRGINGVDAQWIAAEKDWQEAKRRHRQKGTEPPPAPEDEGTYVKDMDAMRCVLYLHGGGYYFGSVDQERYSIQRLARKINGRVFAINYRLSPQYPFPCAIQDALAAYLYLIRPPADAQHTPVDPSHIVVAGDSAGGGLSLALLQVIRDCGLPPPAGGILISPWCDLTHSFPSIHTNTKTDVVPDWGLSFHKPSALWPPPPKDLTERVHASIRHRIRQAFRPDQVERQNTFDATLAPETPATDAAAPALPSVDPPRTIDTERVCVQTATGPLETDNQLHFYTKNSLLLHPLISPAFSYLGDLPPLFFIASDKEVLRDEIIYTAHRAADPSKYPIKQSSYDLYPALKAFTAMKPTSVHLQVYDDTAHVLPILFAFTTPAKFCFRAMANFVKFVTEMPLPPSQSTLSNGSSGTPGLLVPPERGEVGDSSSTNSGETSKGRKRRSVLGLMSSGSTSDPLLARPSLRRAISSRVSRASSFLSRDQTVETPSPMDSGQELLGVPPRSSDETDVRRGTTTSSDVAGPRFSFSRISLPSPLPPGQALAGDIAVYQSIKNRHEWECGMLRERVSTEGVIRSLEAVEDLEPFKLSEDLLGGINELVLKRYLDTQARFDQKFGHTYKVIDKDRRKNLERSKRDTMKRLSQFRQTLRSRNNVNVEKANGVEGSQPPQDEVESYLLSSPGWSFAWALDEHENPPPSSIVARRDTEEARKLAEFADQALIDHDHALSGNNLWSIVVDFFTVSPEKRSTDTKSEVKEKEKVQEVPKEAGSLTVEQPHKPKHSHRHRISRFMRLHCIPQTPTSAEKSPVP